MPNLALCVTLEPNISAKLRKKIYKYIKLFNLNHPQNYILNFKTTLLLILSLKFKEFKANLEVNFKPQNSSLFYLEILSSNSEATVVTIPSLELQIQYVKLCMVKY